MQIQDCGPVIPQFANRGLFANVECRKQKVKPYRTWAFFFPSSSISAWASPCPFSYPLPPLFPASISFSSASLSFFSFPVISPPPPFCHHFFPVSSSSIFISSPTLITFSPFPSCVLPLQPTHFISFCLLVLFNVFIIFSLCTKP